MRSLQTRDRARLTENEAYGLFDGRLGLGVDALVGAFVLSALHVKTKFMRELTVVAHSVLDERRAEAARRLILVSTLLLLLLAVVGIGGAEWRRRRGGHLQLKAVRDYSGGQVAVFEMPVDLFGVYDAC